MKWLPFVAFLIAALSGSSETSETRAVTWLAREVPAWSRENKCFSCHNNGDGARALYQAKRLGYEIPGEALAETTKWLTQPERWDGNKGDPAFSDKRLANLQFAAALHWAKDAPNKAASSRVARDQSPSGAWEIDTSNPVGSPTTYGTALATYMALQVLSGSTHEKEIRKAWGWFRKVEPKNTLTAAALMLASRLETNRLRPDQLEQSFQYLISSQNPDGGWGPYANTPSEPFDTAIAVLALARAQTAASLVIRGRQFLTREQNADGSWPPTTRPPKGDSYAQQVATTAWALMALLETKGESRGAF